MTPPPDISSTLSVWHAALVLGPALAAAAAALRAGPRAACEQAWRGARWATAASLVLALLSLAAVLTGRGGSGFGLRADAVGGVVMLLVAFVGWVIVRYSQPYLQGERHERHYVRWLMATLATVGVVVATNHVLLLALAWAATSLALHRLLTFFGHRPAAVVAAHKKFIVGRAADLCILAASALLFIAFGTMDIDQIVRVAGAPAAVPLAAQAATLLLACAALLKCAQLPFHGWLIQVMEAPTPVSALLHAGVVNLGGFVLIRFAPLVEQVPAAQVLLVLAGTTTAVLAALVMTTRISIKVSLAWSTCAQMGFMLMQCGLGLWQMALLHLLAHSLYKAHAFLSAGGVVRRTMVSQLAAPPAAPGPLGWSAGILAGVGLTLVAGAAFGLLAAPLAAPPVVWVMAGIVALALVPLVQVASLKHGGQWLPGLLLGGFGVALASFGLHALFARWLGPVASQWGAGGSALWLVVALAFGGLFLLQSLVSLAPQSGLARQLYPWFYGGLFLDEKFNQVAFRLWPPPPPLGLDALLPVADPRAVIPTPVAHNLGAQP